MKLPQRKQHFATGLPTVNLLSASVFDAIAVSRLRSRFMACVVVLAVLIGLGLAVQHLRAVEAEKLLVVEQAETARLTAQAEELAAVSAFVKEVAAQKVLIQRTMANEAFLSRVLDALRRVTPPGIRVETLAAEIVPPKTAKPGAEPEAEKTSACPAPDPFADQAAVGCVSLSGTATTRGAVGQFVIELGRSGMFLAPYINTTTASAGARITFTGSVSLSRLVYSNRYAKIDALLATGGGR